MGLLHAFLCGVIFVFACASIQAEDMDMETLRARLAQQQVRLEELQKKMYEGDEIIDDSGKQLRRSHSAGDSTVTTRYFYRNGIANSATPPPSPNNSDADAGK